MMFLSLECWYRASHLIVTRGVFDRCTKVRGQASMVGSVGWLYGVYVLSNSTLAKLGVSLRGIFWYSVISARELCPAFLGFKHCYRGWYGVGCFRTITEKTANDLFFNVQFTYRSPLNRRDHHASGTQGASQV